MSTRASKRLRTGGEGEPPTPAVLDADGSAQPSSHPAGGSVDPSVPPLRENNLSGPPLAPIPPSGNRENPRMEPPQSDFQQNEPSSIGSESNEDQSQSSGGGGAEKDQESMPEEEGTVVGAPELPFDSEYLIVQEITIKMRKRAPTPATLTVSIKGLVATVADEPEEGSLACSVGFRKGDRICVLGAAKGEGCTSGYAGMYHYISADMFEERKKRWDDNKFYLARKKAQDGSTQEPVKEFTKKLTGDTIVTSTEVVDIKHPVDPVGYLAVYKWCFREMGEQMPKWFKVEAGKSTLPEIQEAEKKYRENQGGGDFQVRDKTYCCHELCGLQVFFVWEGDSDETKTWVPLATPENIFCVLYYYQLTVDRLCSKKFFCGGSGKDLLSEIKSVQGIVRYFTSLYKKRKKRQIPPEVLVRTFHRASPFIRVQASRGNTSLKKLPDNAPTVIMRETTEEQKEVLRSWYKFVTEESLPCKTIMDYQPFIDDYDEEDGKHFGQRAVETLQKQGQVKEGGDGGEVTVASYVEAVARDEVLADGSLTVIQGGAYYLYIQTNEDDYGQPRQYKFLSSIFFRKYEDVQQRQKKQEVFRRVIQQSADSYLLRLRVVNTAQIDVLAFIMTLHGNMAVAIGRPQTFHLDKKGLQETCSTYDGCPGTQVLRPIDRKGKKISDWVGTIDLLVSQVESMGGESSEVEEMKQLHTAFRRVLGEEVYTSRDVDWHSFGQAMLLPCEVEVVTNHEGKEDVLNAGDCQCMSSQLHRGPPPTGLRVILFAALSLVESYDGEEAYNAQEQYTALTLWVTKVQGVWASLSEQERIPVLKHINRLVHLGLPQGNPLSGHFETTPLFRLLVQKIEGRAKEVYLKLDTVYKDNKDMFRTEQGQEKKLKEEAKSAMSQTWEDVCQEHIRESGLFFEAKECTALLLKTQGARASFDCLDRVRPQSLRDELLKDLKKRSRDSKDKKKAWAGPDPKRFQGNQKRVAIARGGGHALLYEPDGSTYVYETREEIPTTVTTGVEHTIPYMDVATRYYLTAGKEREDKK